jgi:hypothetical protein
MKVESWLFGAGVFVFAPLGMIYGHFTNWREPVGTVSLFLTAGLSALIGFYLWWTGRKLDPRPEDDPLAPVSAFEGEFGFFSPHSWWPLAVGASVGVIFLGLAVGWWLVIIGAAFAPLALIGWTYEYFRGADAV